MELLRSSIIGREFVNYRKTTIRNTRLQFSQDVLRRGRVPIVVDSVDPEISNIIRGSNKSNNFTESQYDQHEFTENIKYGKELVYNINSTISDVLRDIKILFLNANREDLFVSGKNILSVGLENGTIVDLDNKLGNLYKTHKNADDKILYLLISKETTVWGYIISILRYLKRQITDTFASI